MRLSPGIESRFSTISIRRVQGKTEVEATNLYILAQEHVAVL